MKDWFLKEVKLDPRTALLEYNLAPLETRQETAMLGLLRRAILRDGFLQL